jgi:hypothetical protein
MRGVLTSKRTAVKRTAVPGCQASRRLWLAAPAGAGAGGRQKGRGGRGRGHLMVGCTSRVRRRRCMPEPASPQPADPGGSTATADDPRLAFIYQEALRGLL